MAEFMVLRVVHVLGGVFWVGAALFNGIYLLPALAAAGPAAGAIMASFQQRRAFVVLPVIAVLTILSGLRLMWLTSGGFAPAYFASGQGATFSAAGGAAILAFLLGIFIARPAGVRMGVLGPALARTEDAAERATLAAEMRMLQRRSRIVALVVNTLLILAAAGMAVGRYVR